jgi:hypothetical protein
MRGPVDGIPVPGNKTVNLAFAVFADDHVWPPGRARRPGLSVQRLGHGRRGISIIFAGPLVISRTSECRVIS